MQEMNLTTRVDVMVMLRDTQTDGKMECYFPPFLKQAQQNSNLVNLPLKFTSWPDSAVLQ